MQHSPNHASRNIYTVSKLTQKIKALLEKNYSILWLSGEISNIRVPASGHAYFSLKDEKAQISAVMFKGQLRQLKFKLEDGAKIIGLGRLSVYEPRGSYQIILEYAEPHGAGALQIAFEQLKRQLEGEGLFDSGIKKALPYLPTKIGVITSPNGAVIRDILRVLNRRYPQMAVDVLPVRVQGESAIQEIVDALDTANRHSSCDLIILARGGGSFEDMAAFNSEAVARAIYASDKPVVSAIGHETDFSIADFVADLRAPTPSAAAEIAVPIKSDLIARNMELYHRCRQALIRRVSLERNRLAQLAKNMRHLIRGLQNQQMRYDDLNERLLRAGTIFVQNRWAQYINASRSLLSNKPDKYMLLYKSKHQHIAHRLIQAVQRMLSRHLEQLRTLDASLRALNPNAILQRGYSITRTLPHRNIVNDTQQVNLNDHLEVQLAHGALEVEVLHKSKIK